MLGIGVLLGIAFAASFTAAYRVWRFRLDREAERSWFEQEQQWWHALREEA